MGRSSERSPETEQARQEVLDGRYRLETLIGRGGMGAVYRAQDLRLGRSVAVKVLRETESADEARFESEVRMLARFTHPNLVSLLDAGEFNGRQYLAMELIEGPTLAQRLSSGVLFPAETAEIGTGIAGALAYVHHAGIVHRDVKPANVLLDRWGTARLADFGIARLVDTTGLTATGLTLGTPAYLAPEQVQGETIGPPADVYALGLVLIECVSGHRAFEGTPSEIAAARIQRAPAIPDDFDAPWHALLESTTALDPMDRPSAAEAASLLGQRTRVSAPHSIEWGSLANPQVNTVRLGGATLASAELLDEARTLPAPTRTMESKGRSDTRGGWRLGRAKLVPMLLGLAVLGAALGIALANLHLGASPSRAGVAGDPHHATTSLKTVATTTSTTTSTTTTTTTTPVVTVASESGALVTALDNGVSAGDVSTQAAQQLTNEIQQLALSSSQGPPQQESQQFDQVVQTFYQEVQNGQITGSATVSSLTGSLQQLATTIGTTLPSTTVVTTPVPPGFGNGNGNGNGPGHGH